MSPSPRWRDRVDDLSDEFLAIRVGNATPTVAQQRRARADAMRALSPSAHRSRTQVVQIAPPTATRSPAAPAGDNFHDRVLTRPASTSDIAARSQTSCAVAKVSVWLTAPRSHRPVAGSW